MILGLLLLASQDAAKLAEEAAARYGKRDFAFAHAKASEAVRLDDSHPAAHRWLTLATLRLGRLEEGRAALRAARSRGATFDDVELARALASAGDVEEALRLLADDETRHGVTADSLEARGAIQSLKGNSGEAIDLYERAINSDPNRAAVLGLAVADLLARGGRTEAARERLRRIDKAALPASLARGARALEAAIEASLLQLEDEKAAPLVGAFAPLKAILRHGSIARLLGADAAPLLGVVERMETAVKGGADLDRAAADAVAATGAALDALRQNPWVIRFVTSERARAAAWGRSVAGAADRRQRERILTALMARLWTPP